MQHADWVPIAGHTRGGAHTHFTEKFGVVGDSGKIQWPIYLQLSPCQTVVVVGLNTQGLSPGEAVGIDRPIACILGAGVE